MLRTEDSLTTATGIPPWFVVFSGVYVPLTVLGSLIPVRMARRRCERIAAGLEVAGD